MSRVHTDLSRVPISVAPSPATSGLSLGVTDANAAKLPDVYPWWGVCVPTGQAPTRTNAEIVKVTGGSSSGGTTTYTIVRAQGVPVTTAQSISTSFDIYEAVAAESQGSLSIVPGVVPSGLINGSNTVFTAPDAYVAGTLKVYYNGLRQKGGGSSYTETTPSSGVFTMAEAPLTDSEILIDYEKAVSNLGNADTVDGINASDYASNEGQLVPYYGGWVKFNATFTYSSASIMNANVDLTAYLQKGDKVRFKQGAGWKYGYILAISSTQITITGGSDYTVANSAITDVWFSHESNPIGFPAFFNYTPTYTGFSANPNLGAKFSIDGNLVTINFIILGDGTSNASDFTATIIGTSTQYSQQMIHVRDNGTNKTGYAQVDPSGTTVAFYTSTNKDGFASSGNKSCSGWINYYL